MNDKMPIEKPPSLLADCCFVYDQADFMEAPIKVGEWFESLTSEEKNQLEKEVEEYCKLNDEYIQSLIRATKGVNHETMPKL